MEKCIKNWSRSTGKTAFWFLAFCASIPIFFGSYLILSCVKSVWLCILSIIYSQLDFVKTANIRNILDTHRNQGIIHVLLHVQGKCNIGVIREGFTKYVLERKNLAGNLQFSKLRRSFTKKWGYYAWLRNQSDFNINNHVILGPLNHLGRSINENNIEEYISGIVSKYMPVHLPQWQIVVIPTSNVNRSRNSESYYMLVRIHHLILSEEQELRLSDIILVDPSPISKLLQGRERKSVDLSDPFNSLIPNVVHMEQLYCETSLIVCGRWNELLNNYNRYHDDELGKEQQGLFKLSILIAVAAVTVIINQAQIRSTINYLKLAYNAITELLELLYMIVLTPRKIYEELFLRNTSDNYALQDMSLCGRKVVSWSDKINVNDLARICKRNKLSPNEVFFSASSVALYAFLDEFKGKIPNNLDACARYFERDDLLGTTNYSDSDDVTGYILVSLPLEPHTKRQIKKIRRDFAEVQQNQVPLFLLYIALRRYDILTKILPHCWIKLLFNYLSKKFTVSITKMADSTHPEVTKMLWNHKILDVIYFTPPQSNLSVSLTIQSYGEHIRLGVMTDAIIRPFHKKISKTWAKYIQEIVCAYD